MCPSFTAPAGIPRNDVPQFVKLSMDDWLVGPETKQLIYGAAGSAYKDARGCTPRLTAFTSTMWTDYRFAEQLFKDGHEIALHTVSHSTAYTSPLEKWQLEIGTAKRYMTTFSEVPEKSIIGFRAPYLGFNTAMFTAMQQFNLTYDSSMVCIPNTPTCPYGKFYWPYTLDYGPALPCGFAAGNQCPGNLPGVWESPMTMLADPRPNAVMDPTAKLFMDPTSPAGLYTF
jgi:hypothetical protein